MSSGWPNRIQSYIACIRARAQGRIACIKVSLAKKLPERGEFQWKHPWVLLPELMTRRKERHRANITETLRKKLTEKLTSRERRG